MGSNTPTTPSVKTKQLFYKIKIFQIHIWKKKKSSYPYWVLQYHKNKQKLCLNALNPRRAEWTGRKKNCQHPDMKKKAKLLTQPLMNARIVCKTDTQWWLESDEYFRLTRTLQWTGEGRDEFLCWSQRVDPLSTSVRTQETKPDRLKQGGYTPGCNPLIPLWQTKTPNSHISVPLYPSFLTHGELVIVCFGFWWLI